MSTPGLAVPAEQPQTEFISTSVVPLASSWLITSSGVLISLNPFSVSSSFIGITNCSGYIVWVFLKQRKIRHFVHHLIKVKCFVHLQSYHARDKMNYY